MGCPDGTQRSIPFLATSDGGRRALPDGQASRESGTQEGTKLALVHADSYGEPAGAGPELLPSLGLSPNGSLDSAL